MKHICSWISIQNHFDLELMYCYIEDLSLAALNTAINYINCVID